MRLDVVNLRQYSLGLDLGALRRVGGVARRGTDPAPGHLQRTTRAPRAGASDRTCRLRAEPVRRRFRPWQRPTASRLRRARHRIRAVFAFASAEREAGGVIDNDLVLAIANTHGATPAQVRIAWTLDRGRHVLAIPGTSNPAHLEQHVASGELRLSTKELAILEGVGAA